MMDYLKGVIERFLSPGRRRPAYLYLTLRRASRRVG
jgi:hypothetical protein